MIEYTQKVYDTLKSDENHVDQVIERSNQDYEDKAKSRSSNSKVKA